MEEKIREALRKTGIKSFFIMRDEKYLGECIVYNYTSSPGYYSDNKEKSRRYTILLNVYLTSKIEGKKSKIYDAMIEAGFKGGQIQRTEKETIKELQYFNTPMMFKGRL